MSTTVETRSLTRDVTTDELGKSDPDAAALIVARWHDDTHAGSYRTCQEQPCAAVRSVND